MCVPCLDNKIQGSALLQRKKSEFDVHLEMIQEKFDELNALCKTLLDVTDVRKTALSI
jgi:hypothetical protein